ncbi:MAG: FAD:protein FMN transferase [Phycisphaerae bacterium]|nr:FAD:protein FMN transferase [Phycisphaerae bacterium]
MFKAARVIFGALVLCALGCREESNSPARVAQSREVMGTLACVTAIAPDETTARAAVEAAYARLDDVNRLMSDYRADSEIGRLNALSAGESLIVSPETFYCLQRAAEIAEASGGAFDATCRPLVELWKQAGRQNALPDEATLAATRERVGWQKIGLDAATRRVIPMADGLQIDLGGIAKGYALDLAGEAILATGASAGLVDVGGDVRAVGEHTWTVGVRHPFAAGLIETLALSSGSVATSGNQQRFYMIDGHRYSHIIDPRSGRPTEQAPSVTVIAPDGLTADAWATVFSVLSAAEGQARAAELDGVEVLWIWGSAEQPQIAATEGFTRHWTGAATTQPSG